MWNPIEALRKKLGGQTAPESKPAVPKELLEAVKGGTAPDMKELEKKGLLGKFFRHWKDPAFLRQIKAVAARMQAEGVNVKDTKAVKAWIDQHQKEIESGQLASAPAAQQKTVVKTGPEIGRNDPCTCGSGKKYKKCCGK